VVGTLAKPWTVAMEATMFTGWIYDYLRLHAAAVKVAHPLMLRAIAVAKKKNDRIDAGRIADCLRCDFLPECYMAPMEIRQRRRTLRYRKLLVRQNVQLKNKIAQLLMESGVSYNKEKLHQQGYFHQVLPANPEIDPSLWPLLKLTREMIERTQKTERALLRSLEADPLLATRVERLMTIPAHRPRHGADLGARSRRGRAVPLRQAGHQLLWPVQRRENFGPQFQAHAHLQTAQSTLADGAVGGRASGSETQPGAGRPLRARSRAEQPQPGYHRRRPQAGSLPSGHRSWRTCLRNSPGSQQSRSITAAAIFRAFQAHSARSHNFSAERRSIRSQGSNSLVSRLAENLNSNICDGSGLRQQMDVWFCVPPQEPKTKAL
jgi:Transposase